MVCGFRCPVACGILVPQPGMETKSLALEGRFFFFNVFLFGCAGSSLLHAGFSLVAVSRGYTVVVVHRLLVAAASFVAEHRL